MRFIVQGSITKFSLMDTNKQTSSEEPRDGRFCSSTNEKIQYSDTISNFASGSSVHTENKLPKINLAVNKRDRSKPDVPNLDSIDSSQSSLEKHEKLSKRALQNRLAQRAFRKRKEEFVSSLQERLHKSEQEAAKVPFLENQNNLLRERCQVLQDKINELLQKTVQIRKTVRLDSVLL